MSRRRKSKRRHQGEVELNVTAMLDMAFQLLAFFILTFRPAPVEGEFLLRLPPPGAVTNVAAENAEVVDATDAPREEGLKSLTIGVFPTASGEIESMVVGGAKVTGLRQLEAKVKSVLSLPGQPYDQIIIQAGPNLRYERLMNVIEICTRQTLPDGKKMTRINLVELPTATP